MLFRSCMSLCGVAASEYAANADNATELGAPERDRHKRDMHSEKSDTFALP